MKRFIYLTFFAFAFLAASCDLLEEKPEGFLVSENYYKTESDAVAAVNAVYAPLNKGWNIYWRGLYLMAELPTDNAVPGGGVNNPNILALNNYTVNPVNDRIEVLYQTHYLAINRANIVTDRVPAIQMNEQKKMRIVGEASFLRALLYFNLVRLFGDVPLLTSETKSLSDNLLVERAPAETVYNQIIKDLLFAEQHLSPSYSGGDVGRATRWAAKALLAKVYLTRGEWALAAAKAKEVIDSGSHLLLENYADVFRAEKKNHKESIFAIQYQGDSDGNGFQMILTLPRNTIPGVVGNSADIPALEYYNSFMPEDTRKDRTFFTTYTRNNQTYNFPPHWAKYLDESAIARGNEASSNFEILRYADVLLMYAEALNELNGPSEEAYRFINMVRRRAFGESISAPSEHDLPTNLSKEGFRNAVLDERRWEFGFEGQRWFDLVRTGKLVEVLTAKGYQNVQPFRTKYPIPQRELDTNAKLSQNTGY